MKKNRLNEKQLRNIVRESINEISMDKLAKAKRKSECYCANYKEMRFNPEMLPSIYMDLEYAAKMDNPWKNGGTEKWNLQAYKLYRKFENVIDEVVQFLQRKADQYGNFESEYIDRVDAAEKSLANKGLDFSSDYDSDEVQAIYNNATDDEKYWMDNCW